MIIVKLKGGLGNQMFQYATGKALAEKSGSEFKLDTSWFGNQILGETSRTFELDQFNITASIASQEEIARTKQKGFSSLRRLIRQKLFRQFNDPLPAHTLTKEDIYLEGFWQNENNFTEIRDILCREFSLVNPLGKQAEIISQEIYRENSVSIHVRRGDYVTDKRTNEHHGTSSLDYYKKAIEIIKEKISDPHFFIFSDDIEWTKKNLIIESGCTFVSDRRTIKDAEEMTLLSLCKHNIITNSSFSWWGAWLNQNHGKIVIAPKQWFKNPKANANQSIVPKSWITP